MPAQSFDKSDSAKALDLWPGLRGWAEIAEVTNGSVSMAEDHGHPGSPHAVSTNRSELYEAVFDHSNDAIFVIDPANDCIVDANPRACTMLGYTREELLSLPVSAIHPGEMAVLQAFSESVYENGRGWTNELNCQTKYGEILPVEISASAIQITHEDPSGQIIESRHIIAMVRDITERLQAEAAERELVLVEERNRLAREIHDSLAQGLTAIIWQLNGSEMVVKAGGEAVLDSLNQVRELAKESLQEARRSVWNLRSGPLRAYLWRRHWSRRRLKLPARIFGPHLT